ncbi:MAG TPA: four helix bundle protein [Cyclobacteriaceae bacterium]
MKQQELEDRLIKFSVNVVSLTKTIRRTTVSVHLIGQLVRSATAPALMYAEACAAESPQDFIHKMSMALKELRETRINLRMILLNDLAGGPSIDGLLDENEQLIAIFWKSIDTARRNRLKPGQPR